MKIKFVILSILLLATAHTFGQARPGAFSKRTNQPKIVDSTLINYTYYEILLVRYLPTRGEFGGTTDSITIFRSNECPDSIRAFGLHCNILRLSYSSVEQIFGPDSAIALSQMKIDSIQPKVVIHQLVNEAIKEVYEGAKEVYNGEVNLWGDGYCEISMGFGYERHKDFKLSSNRMANKWGSFEKLKEIILLAQKE